MKKFTYEEVKLAFEAEGCTLLSTEYLGCDFKLEYVCSCGEISKTSFYSFSRGRRCKKCGKKNNKNKKSIQEVKKIFHEAGFILLDEEYINTSTKLKCICTCGNHCEKSLESVRLGQKCRKCAFVEIGKKKTLDYKSVNDFFTSQQCILLSKTYENCRTKLDYICSCGNQSKISWSDFKSGRRCKKCRSQKISLAMKKAMKKWGGFTKKNIPRYDTYAHKIEFCEEVKRDPEDKRILNVRCSMCGTWFRPTASQVKHRVEAFVGKASGESRFYCSDKCKQSCPIFYQQVWPKGLNPSRPRQGQSEFREMVLERDNYTCQICGHHDPCGEFLVAHHVDPVACNPIESMDVDNGITLCGDCHQHAHNLPGCSTSELRAASYLL